MKLFQFHPNIRKLCFAFQKIENWKQTVRKGNESSLETSAAYFFISRLRKRCYEPVLSCNPGTAKIRNMFNLILWYSVHQVYNTFVLIIIVICQCHVMNKTHLCALQVKSLVTFPRWRLYLSRKTRTSVIIPYGNYLYVNCASGCDDV